MATIYEKADDEVMEVVDRMMAKYHGQLLEAGTRIDVLMAENPDGAAVKCHGISCYAKVRVVSYKDRVKGCGDAEIIIDGQEWATMSSPRRDALIDHELEHLELTGKRDDLDRPKLTILLHDIDVGWFKTIADRHGEASEERRQALRMVDELGQQFFGFARDLKGLKLAQ